MDVAGSYRAQPLFGSAIKDREALSLIASMKLRIDEDKTFVLNVSNTTIKGMWETSGRFLTLHLATVDGEDASKAKGAELSILDQSYEIVDGGAKLSFVNAEPGTPAVQFQK
jgi:hypothetical protein